MKERKNILVYAALSAMTLAGAALAALTQTPFGTSAETSANIYPSTGFENILSEGEDSYDFTNGIRSSVGQVGASIKAIRETVGETSNTYLQMSNGGGSDSFANTFALFPSKLTTARTYSLSFDFRKEAGFTSTDNVGFRFWTDAATLKDGDGLASQINAAEIGTWVTVKATYELSAAQAAVGADSLQLWFNTKDGTTLNVLDVDNVSITYDWNIGENVYPSEGFENMLGAAETSYDLGGGLRNGVGQVGASVKVLKETSGETSNTYLQMSNGGGSDSFANTFALFSSKLVEAKTFNISIDFRKEAGFTSTDNVGFRFWTDAATLKDGEGLASKVNAGAAETWFTVTSTYELSAAQAAVGADSFQLWFNTKDGTTLNVLDVDNVKITAIVPEATIPTVNPAAATWYPETPTDIVFTVDLKGYALAGVTDEGETALTASQVSLSGTSLTFKSDYLASLDSGSHIFTIATEKGTVQVVITTLAAKGTIPSSTDGYTLTPTLLGGTFEGYDIGTKFSEAQTPEAWGSLSSYDDPGEIVDDGAGNHVLQLKRATGSSKTYSSAFCMTSTDIAKNDIVTFKFDYKMNTTDAANVLGKGINVCFVGGSNIGYHQIALDGSKPTTTSEGNTDEYTYDIAYTELATGYTHVEMSFIVDFAFLNSTNSVRFLMQIPNDNDALYIDNVELVRWVVESEDETPTISPATATFDYSAQADLAFTVDLKSYNISSIKLDGATVSSRNYSLDGTTLTVSKDYLATLDNGDHVFTLNTLGGSATFTITVANHGTEPVETPSAALPGWAIALIVVGGVIVLAGAGTLIYFLIKKRKAN